MEVWGSLCVNVSWNKSNIIARGNASNCWLLRVLWERSELQFQANCRFVIAGRFLLRAALRERERERERKREKERQREQEMECVCVRERQREKEMESVRGRKITCVLPAGVLMKHSSETGSGQRFLQIHTRTLGQILVVNFRTFWLQSRIVHCNNWIPEVQSTSKRRKLDPLDCDVYQESRITNLCMRTLTTSLEKWESLEVWQMMWTVQDPGRGFSDRLCSCTNSKKMIFYWETGTFSTSWSRWIVWLVPGESFYTSAWPGDPRESWEIPSAGASSSAVTCKVCQMFFIINISFLWGASTM